MKITLTGRPISKKRNYRRSKNGGLYLSQTYKDYEEITLWDLKKVKEKFKGNVYIDYKFYLKGQLSLDGDNAEAGVNDMLQASGIIENDKYIKEHHTTMIAGNKDWKTELIIEVI